VDDLARRGKDVHAEIDKAASPSCKEGVIQPIYQAQASASRAQDPDGALPHRRQVCHG
jgi:hypothetical protein